MADVIEQLLEDTLEAAGTWEDLIADLAEEASTSSFPMNTVLHQFSSAVISDTLYRGDLECFDRTPEWIEFQLSVVPEEHRQLRLWTEIAMGRHGLSFEPFEGWYIDETERNGTKI